jgi:DNA-binding XRE family transcriptional regulator
MKHKELGAKESILENSEDYQIVFEKYEQLAAAYGQEAIINLLKIYADLIEKFEDDAMTIKMLRIRYGWTSAKMAKILGIEPFALSTLETGKYPISQKVAKVIFDKFKIRTKSYLNQKPGRVINSFLPDLDFDEEPEEHKGKKSKKRDD